MIRALESLGERMLGVFVPKVTASAGCPPDPWCRKCGMCHLQRCYITPRCGVSCGGCGYFCSGMTAFC